MTRPMPRAQISRLMSSPAGIWPRIRRHVERLDTKGSVGDILDLGPHGLPGVTIAKNTQVAGRAADASKGHEPVFYVLHMYGKGNGKGRVARESLTFDRHGHPA